MEEPSKKEVVLERLGVIRHVCARRVGVRESLAQLYLLQDLETPG
jgi:DNA-directed RNA polymerase subunit N (RpoN/RPB10)